MELPVLTQLRELGWALITGLLLGLWYDALRPLRRGRGTGALTDGFYVLTVLVTLLGFTVYGGRGHLRIFAVAAIWAAGALHLRWISPQIRKLQTALGLLAGGPRGRDSLPTASEEK